MHLAEPPFERTPSTSVGDMVRIGDVISAGFMRSTERHPVLRAGEREEIPIHVRAAIWYRDRGLCAMCPGQEYQPEGPLHLDHIMPWSAGGPDTSDNLRLLCEPHNLDRSNFVDHAGPKQSVTWWCHRCYDADGPEWLYFIGGLVECPRHRSRRTKDGALCRVERAYERARASDAEPNWWHMRESLVLFTRTAYCAHCNQPGETNVIL